MPRLTIHATCDQAEMLDTNVEMFTRYPCAQSAGCDLSCVAARRGQSCSRAGDK